MTRARAAGGVTSKPDLRFQQKHEDVVGSSVKEASCRRQGVAMIFHSLREILTCFRCVCLVILYRLRRGIFALNVQIDPKLAKRRLDEYRSVLLISRARRLPRNELPAFLESTRNYIVLANIDATGSERPNTSLKCPTVMVLTQP